MITYYSQHLWSWVAWQWSLYQSRWEPSRAHAASSGPVCPGTRWWRSSTHSFQSNSCRPRNHLTKDGEKFLFIYLSDDSWTWTEVDGVSISLSDNVPSRINVRNLESITNRLDMTRGCSWLRTKQGGYPHAEQVTNWIVFGFNLLSEVYTVHLFWRHGMSLVEVFSQSEQKVASCWVIPGCDLFSQQHIGKPFPAYLLLVTGR